MDIWAQLREIDWSTFQTAYGPAHEPVFRRGKQIQRPVPDDLESLRSPNIDKAIRAAHDLDNGLCHQHVQLSRAALPALPYILDALDHVDPLQDRADELTERLVEILFGMAVMVARPTSERNVGKEWVKELLERLRAEVPRFVELSSHRPPAVRETAEELVRVLEHPVV